MEQNIFEMGYMKGNPEKEETKRKLYIEHIYLIKPTPLPYPNQ